MTVLNLRRWFRDPLFLLALAAGLIAFVILGDIVWFGLWALVHSVQPYRTYEDLNKLAKLQDVDEEKEGLLTLLKLIQGKKSLNYNIKLSFQLEFF